MHCENGGAIEALRRQALAEGRTGVLEHRATRPAALEADAITRLARLCERAEAPAYVVHLSSAPGLAAVREAAERGVGLHAETCPQYLHLDASVYERPDGEQFVCTPPLRDPWHREELWEGLARGWVHTVATDHCPFWSADRHAGTAGRADGWADFTEIPGGLPGIETRLTLVWQGVRAGRITATDWVRLCCEAPARTFGLFPRKGCLRVGQRRRRRRVGPGPVAVARRRRPAHAGRPLALRGHRRHRVAVAGAERGRVVARDGTFTGEPAAGRYLERGIPDLTLGR